MDIPRPKKKIALTAAERKAISRANQSEEAKEKEKSRNREDKKTPKAMAKTRERMKKIHTAKMKKKEKEEKFPQPPELRRKILGERSTMVNEIWMYVEVNCYPGCKFTWYKDGKELQKTKGKIWIRQIWYFKTIDGIQRKGNSSLEISRPNPNDAGLYTVRVTNEHGESEHSFKVDFMPEQEGKRWKLKESIDENYVPSKVRNVIK